MSTPDIIILIFFIPAIIRGVQKGFIAQVMSLTALILGVWLSFHFSEIICEALEPHLPGVSGMVLQVIGFLILFLIVAVLLFLAGKLIKGILKMACLGWVDWALGIVFSMLTAALVMGLFIILFDSLNLRFGFVSDEAIGETVLYTPLKNFAYKVFPYLKALLFKQ